jgi:hypothetical protein
MSGCGGEEAENNSLRFNKIMRFTWTCILSMDFPNTTAMVPPNTVYGRPYHSDDICT